MATPRSLQSRSIILKKQPQGENDLRVTLYTPMLGKIQAIAKGGRKISSSFSGHLEPLNLCQLQIYRTPYHFTITQCQVEKNFKNIRENFERSMIGTLLLEILQKTTYSDEYCQELFDLFEKTLNKLDRMDHTFLIVESFKLKLLDLLGVLPDLSNCSACHQRASEDQEIWLDHEGHFRCSNCVHGMATNAKKMDFLIIKLIHFLLNENNENQQKINLSPGHKKELKYITRLFLENYISKEIVSEKILARIYQM